MRDAIRTRILNEVNAITNVYQPFMPGPETEKPFAVVKMGTEGATNMRYGFDVPVQVWVYVDPTSFATLDGLLRDVIDALVGKDLVTGDGEVFRLRCSGGLGEDFFDEEWNALTRYVMFGTETVRGG